MRRVSGRLIATGQRKPMSMVYIIDDDDAVRDSLVVRLEAEGLQAEPFESCESFLERAGASAQGCLILDAHLPGMSGIELIERGAEFGLSLPIIMITGRGQSDLRARGLAAGAYAYLEKPVEDGVLLETVQQAMGAA